MLYAMRVQKKKAFAYRGTIGDYNYLQCILASTFKHFFKDMDQIHLKMPKPPKI